MEQNILNMLRKKKIVWIISIVFIIIILLAGGYSYLPLSRDEMPRSLALIESKSYYVLTANGKDVAYFSGLSLDGDSTFVGFSLSKQKSFIQNFTSAFWVNRYSMIPSQEGLLLASPSGRDSILKVANKNAEQILNKEMVRLKRLLHDKNLESAELRYYLNVHGVMDEGFDMISRYSEKVKIEKDSVSHLLSELRKASHHSHFSVRLISTFSVYYVDNSSKMKKVNCRLLSEKNINGFRLFQTNNKTTPEDAVSLYIHSFFTPYLLKSSTIFAISFEGLRYGSFDKNHLKSYMLPGHLTSDLKESASHDISRTMILDGEPVFSKGGYFVGVTYHGNILNSNQFRGMLNGIE
jgi:hypothetical protein